MERIATSQFTIGMLLQATFFAALTMSCLVLPINVDLRLHVLLAASGAVVGTFAHKTILGALLGVIVLYSLQGFVVNFEALTRGIY